MRARLLCVGLLAVAPCALAQSSGRFPPDSLVNTTIIPRGTPVQAVIGRMRNFSVDLGVRCTHCHLGEEGKPLATFDFASDEKRTKIVAREMMRMVDDINARLQTLPGRSANGLQVTCATCHRGLSRPMTLAAFMTEAATTVGADSAVRAYKVLWQRYYGSDAYDFRENSLNGAAFRLARAQKFEEALAMLRLNEEKYPAGVAMFVTRGTVMLLKGDTTAAEAAFREAIRRDPANDEAKGRLREIGRQP
ncbi:MAG: c-type cytochrome [Gemmatimonadaceae bacterium]|nr:c-type cytochrome [Gemmatimonadaceae bacterium]